MKREYSADVPELMDLPKNDEAELKSDLVNLETINRHFGGGSAVLRMFERMRPESGVKILALATGYGDHPRRMVEWAKRNGLSVEITAVDVNPQTLHLAQEATARDFPIRFESGDIRQLPYEDCSFDFVFCSLALHHFSQEDATRILAEMRRIARRKAVCIDLVRGRLAFAAVWLLTCIWLRDPMTRHDARLSVRRAFSTGEMQWMAVEAGWDSTETVCLPWFRQAILFSRT